MGDDGARLTVGPRKEWFSLQNPIGVIGGFAAVVEVALILAAIFVDGHARWALILFAIVAFFYVAYKFFWILINSPWVLYPPKEYGGETGIVTFIETMISGAPKGGLADPKAKKLAEGEVQGSATSVTLAKAMIPPLPDPTLPDAPGAFEMAGFLVYMAPRKPDSLGLFVEYEAFDSVTHCLGYIGIALLGSIDSSDSTETIRRHDMNYGTTWVLRDMRTHRILAEIGTAWAWKMSGSLADMRRLQDTELKPGMRLELVRLQENLLPITGIISILKSSDERGP